MENNSNILSIYKNFQGVASLGSERPKESPNVGTSLLVDRPKTRIRYSGAARRRYKKLQQREGRVGCTRIIVPKTVSISKDEREHAPVADKEEHASKAKLEHNILSSAEDCQDKRPKISDQGSYAQATKELVKLALILEGYPDKKLGTSEVALIRKLIRGRILDLPEDRKAPIFTGSWERDGALVFSCADEQSGDWLRSLASDIKIGEISLRVQPFDELLKRHRVVIHVEEPDISVEDAVKLLDKQNIGLVANEWIVARGSDNRDAMSTYFACLVSDSSLDALKVYNFRPFCGSGRAAVKLLKKERRKITEEAAVGTESVEPV